MRKMILILIILILIQGSYAYVMPIDYNGVKVKFYDNTANKTAYFEMFDTLPLSYYENLEYIKVFKQGSHVKYAGYYHVLGRGIDMFSGVDVWVLEHELCHHTNNLDGDNVVLIAKHGGGFNACMARYEKAIKLPKYSGGRRK